ncbi:MAG TPA: FtsX-like permease family protein, partial [Vicinamibacterales bacterium]|nr:FtsX-like permease family protein [Vicinamibacterales bacterium]
ILFGLVPALHATQGSLAATLGAAGAAGGTRGRMRLQRLSAISQIALSLALLATAGVLLRSVGAAARAADADEQAGRIISGTLDLAGQGYNTARQRALIAELLDRLRQLPGVESCSATAFGPGQGRMYTGVVVDGQPGDPARPSLVEVTWTLPDYFQTMGMPLVRGRDLGKDHVAGAAVVNEAFARKYWPGEDPIGKPLWMGPRTSPPRTVVGVVRTSGEGDQSQPPVLFVPRLELPEETLPWAIVAKTTGAAAPLAPVLRELVAQLDTSLPLFDLATLRQSRAHALAPRRAASGVLNIFGGLALLLASIGVYGLIGWQLARRRREIGVRMALGASRADVLRMVVGDGGRLAAIGVAIGLALALAATRLMSGLVSGAAASDIPMLLAVSAIVGVVVCAASYLPARRVTRVNPAEVLRAE